MKTFMLWLTVIAGDPETGAIYSFVLDEGMSYEDCQKDLKDNEHIWLGNDNIGMSCVEEQ